ncbi:MAG: ATPase [Methanobrevibacter millerae]|uniref:ATPase n=1 Tax=Methanobrevibacter millerae TaxID=230361 RepID=A0A8T3VKQ1_9EURY|nr:ATPase [Methanobrevibacter millerae]MBE6505260.1 ATPase [Methanobrevibacter millerae]
MDFIFDVSGLTKEDDKFTDSKKDVLKYLKIIGVDTRFVSYTPSKIYINNLRFSKFSKKRQETFKKQYPNIEVVRNSLFQKICSKSAKALSDIRPNSRILIPKDDFMIDVILEPYTRKYGVKLVTDGEYDLIANPIILDDKINHIFSTIFSGEGLEFNKKDNEIYPLINVPLDWINSFLEMDGHEKIKNENNDELASSFMEFLEDVAPQYRENVLKASDYIEKKLML